MADIVVIGSANTDFVVEVERFPQAGETVLGGDLIVTHGGKGANQAVAAARLGGRVAMLGKVGADALGERYLQHLASESIETLFGAPVAGAASGSAQILVDARGENVIVVSPGANHRLTPNDVDLCEAQLSEARLVVMQLEIPIDTAVHAARRVRALGGRVLLNPSPAPERFPWGEVPIDFVVLNQIELHGVTGLGTEAEGDLLDAAKALLAKDVGTVIVTRGKAPTLAVSADACLNVDTFPVTPVDTVGAGDAFMGALAVALGEDMPLHNALSFANAAGALATTRMGAQSGLPRRTEVDKLLADA